MRALGVLVLAALLAAGCTGGGASVPVVENPQGTGANVPNPSIGAVTPSAGFPSTTVTLTGSGFGAFKGASDIRFTGTTTAATVYSWSDTQIVCQVVSTAKAGPVYFVFDGVVLTQSPSIYTVLRWTSQNQEIPTEDYYGVDFPGSNSGFVVGSDSTILHFENDVWSEQAAPAGGQILRAIDMASATQGLIVGGTTTGVAFRTQNGTTWTNQSAALPAPNNRALRAVSQPTPLDAWAVGDVGTVYRTPDGGATWANQSGTTSADLFGVSFVDALNGWAVGDQGTIVHTVDGGANWTFDTSPTLRDLRGVHMLSTSLGYAVGAEGTILRYNGDGTWTDVSLADPRTFTAVFFLDAQTGWVCGTGQAMLFTADGGANWTHEDVGGTEFDLTDVFFLTRATGCTVGLSKTLSRTVPDF